MGNAEILAEWRTYRQVSLATWQDPTALLGDGMLWSTWNRVVSRFDSTNVVVAGARSKNGRTYALVPRGVTPKNFAVTDGESDSFSYSLQLPLDWWRPSLSGSAE